MASNLGCRYCDRECDPGWIDMGNNGPIVPCPICNREDDYDGALAQRAAIAKAEPIQ